MRSEEILKTPQLPGIIHRTTKTTNQSADQAAQVKTAMKKSGGMLGDRSQTLGIFQRMISYAHMPLNDMIAAAEDKLTPEQEIAVQGYVDLITSGMRISEGTLRNWLQGYGATPEDAPPILKDEFDYESRLWKGREAAHQSILQNSSDPTKDWMSRLGTTFEMLQTAIINPFQIDIDAYVPPEVLSRMKDLGLFKLKIPTQYGGLGLHQKEYDKVLRAIVSTTFSGTIGGIISAHSTIGSMPLTKYGTEEQKTKYLTEIAKGEGLCAFGLTEPESGTDAIDNAETTAKQDSNDDWILNGRKMYITNTHRSNLMYVMAKVDDGTGDLKPTVFIVELPFKITDSKEDINRKREELKSIGLHISNPLELMMIRGSNQAYIEFHDFKIPKGNILGKVGDGTKVIFNSLNEGRAGFGSFCAEAARQAFKLSLSEAVQRRRFDLFGGTLADLPNIKGYLSKMAVRTEALNATAELTTALIDKYPNMNIIAEAAAMKAFATEEGWSTAQTVSRIFGGMGTMKGFPVELMMRDLWIPLIVEGVNEALKQHMVGVSAKPALRDSATIGGKFRLIKSRFHYEKGDLNLSDAFWLQRATKRLSFGALWLGMKNKEKTMLKQHELIGIADRAIDLYAAASVLIKLRDSSLPEKQRFALQQFVNNVRSKTDEYPDFIADLYIDDARMEVGQARALNNDLAKKS